MDREGEDEKEPGETEKEQHTANANHGAYHSFFGHYFFFLNSNSPYVSNQHNTDPSEDHYIENHHHKYGSKKSTHQSSNMWEKTAEIKEHALG